VGRSAVNHKVEPERHAHRDDPRVICVGTEPCQSKSDISKPWHYLLLDELPAPVLALDLQGNVAFWNRKCEEITGYAGAELVRNSRAREMLWPDPTCRERVAHLWSGSRDFECTITCKGGQLRHVRWHLMSDRFPVRGWSAWAVGSDVTGWRVLGQTQREHGCAGPVRDVLPDPVAVPDLDGCIEHADRRFVEELGQTETQVHGKMTAHLVTPTNDTFQQLAGEVRLSYRLSPSDFGEPQAIARASRDVAVIKRASEATAEKECMLQALFDAIPESLFLVDAEGKVLACNETAAERVGRSVRELVGSLAVECLINAASSEASEQHMARIAGVFHSGEPVCFTDVGGGLVLEYTLYPVVGDKDQVTSVAIFARDTTRQVQTQKELHECREQLRRATQLASLGTIVIPSTCELTQSLTIVGLAVQTALAELKKLHCPDGAILQDMEASIAASARLAAIVSRFRDYGRQLAKTKETDVRIDRVAERTIRLLEESARQARVSIRIENLDALPAIHVREDELEQVFFALGQNAVHAADGTKDRCLLIAGELRGDEVQLRFEDNCGGIEPANLPRIFEPFFTTKPPGKGIGLGLPVAQQMVLHRGGQISVQNHYGQGVTFVVTLPVSWVHHEIDQDESARAACLLRRR